MKRSILTTAALVLLMACEPQTPSAGPVAETSPAPASLDSLLTGTGSVALIATTPAEAPPLTFTRSVDEAAAAEGMDPVATVRLEAGPEQYLELSEANHTPFDLTAQAADGALASTLELPSGARAAVITQSPGTDRRQDAFETLRDLCRNGTPISAQGLRREIEGWQIEAVSSPRSVDDAGSLVCEVTIQERRVAVLEEVDAPAPRVERGRRPANAGRAESGEGTDGAADGAPADRDQDTSSLARAYLDRVL